MNRRSARWLLLALALAALAFFAGEFVVHAWAVIRFPYQIDYGEGPLLQQAQMVQAGRDIYHNDAAPPYIVANYPPVFVAFVAFLRSLGVGRTGFVAGRLLSGCAMLLSVTLAALIVKRALTDRPGTAPAGNAPLVGAVFAAGLMIAQNFVWRWGPFHRVDSLALAWQMAGLYAVLRRPERAARAWPWFVLAVLTRQSSVEALTASLVWLWMRRRGAAIRLAVCWSLALAAAVAALEWATHGQFLVHVVVYNANRWSVANLAAEDGAWLAAGGAGLLALAVWGWRLAGPRPGADLLRAFAVTSWVVSLTAGKVGSSVNYFFPTIAACSMLAAAVGAAAPRRLAAAALLCAYAIGLPPVADLSGPAGYIVRAVSVWHDPATPDQFSRVRPDPAQAALVARLRASPGPILSEDLGDLVLAGHQIYFQPFELTQVHRDVHWDDSALLARAAAGGFPLVVLNFPLDKPALWHTSRWPAQLLRVLAARYQPAGVLAGLYYLYRPAG